MSTRGGGGGGGYNSTPECTAKKVSVVRSTKGPNNIECYRHVVQVLLGVGRDIYALNPYDTCTPSRESRPIYYLPCGTSKGFDGLNYTFLAKVRQIAVLRT